MIWKNITFPVSLRDAMTATEYWHVYVFKPRLIRIKSWADSTTTLEQFPVSR